MNRFSVTVPGKLVLLGEYAVLEGSPALVVAVDRRCRLTVTQLESDSILFEAVNLDIPSVEFVVGKNGVIEFISETDSKTKQPYRHAIASMETAAQFHSEKLSGLRISIDTSEFYLSGSGQKLGLGSSAAVTVGCLIGLLHTANSDMSTDDLLSLALSTHRLAQNGRGSGVDIAASVTSGMLQYQIEKNTNSYKILKLGLPYELQIIPVWTGISTSTSSFIQKMHYARNNNPDSYQVIIESLRNLTTLGIDNLTGGRLQYFLEIIDEYTNVLDQLGKLADADIVSAVHRKIRDIVRKAGGSYKPSGAGGGDIGIAFTDSLRVRERIIASLRSNGFQVLDLTISEKGIIIED